MKDNCIDVGALTDSFSFDFQQLANEILRQKGLRGSLARLILMEPGAGAWGRNQSELSEHVLNQLEPMLEDQEGFQVTPDGTKRAVVGGFPEIRKALERRAVRFLVGRTPDGTRRVAILLLSEPTSKWQFWRR